MAIEWMTEDCAPVALDELVGELLGTAELIVGECPAGMTVSRNDDVIREQLAVDPRSFFAGVTGNIVDQPFLIQLSMDPALGDGEQYVSAGGVRYGNVSSARDHGSVAMGVCGAIAWLKTAGGRLAGSGFGRWYDREDLDELVDAFTYPGVSPIERLALIHQKIWHG
ncbi:MAG TPA: hypothetical protein VF070_18775 [Streptosporangiaceae bacterium]